jgi:hypothetical protein
MSWFTKSSMNTPEQDQIQAIKTEWQFQLDNAINEADRREIDEIFSRHLESVGI